MPSFRALLPPSALRSPTLRLPLSTLIQQTRAYEVPKQVVFDQTKTDNSPKGEEDKSSKPKPMDENESHPQKQPDPQKTPTSSTGIEPEGPGGARAGEGKGGD